MKGFRDTQTPPDLSSQYQMSHSTSHVPAWQDLLQTPLHAQGTWLQAASSAQGACDIRSPLERGCSVGLPGEDVTRALHWNYIDKVADKRCKGAVGGTRGRCHPGWRRIIQQWAATERTPLSPHHLHAPNGNQKDVSFAPRRTGSTLNTAGTASTRL